MARRFVFDPPDRFVTGTVGPPGGRTFYLQARSGERIVSVSLEKVQVAVLAERLGAMLDELERRGLADPGRTEGDDSPLDEPLNELFRANALTLAWDGDSGQVVIEAREAAIAGEDVDEDEDDDEVVLEADVETGSESDAIDEETLEGIAEAALEAASSLAADDSDVMSVHLPPADARAFVHRTVQVLAAGRPPCPFCGEPLDPQGHLCPRRNGNLLH
ncbi:MAG TPA: DUF3090 domain-containing protein [Candidatus Limnocylindrales bacterium]|nr:DUF3090 domain-containing protein [Candidatus Limnocylindrales bacterium]